MKARASSYLIVFMAGWFWTPLHAANLSAGEAAPSNVVTSISDLGFASNEQASNHLGLNVRLAGTSREDRFYNTKTARLETGIFGSRQMTETLSAELLLYVLAYQSSAANDTGRETNSKNQILLDSALVDFKPWQTVSLRAGVLPIDFTPFESIFLRTGFPGVRQSLHLAGNEWQTSAFALQAIPTTREVSKEPSERGVVSQFYATGLEIGNNADGLSALSAKLSYMRFEYRNLTSAAAEESDGLGNSLLQAAQPRFLYEFKGSETGLGLTYRFNRQWTAVLGGTYLLNEAAPNGKNQAFVYSTGATWSSAEFDLTFLTGAFSNQSDTLPALYVYRSRGYGNNRFGQFFEIRHDLKKQKITSYARYTKMNEIVDQPFAADRDQATLGLEVQYDIL